MKKRTSMIIKLRKNGEMVCNKHLYMNSRVLALAQGENWDKGYIKVAYGQDYYNDANFTSLEQLKEFLTLFTERNLMKDFQ